jgi:cell division protein FtsX
MLVRGPFLVAGVGQGLAGSVLALFFVEVVRRAGRAYVGARPGELIDLVAGRPLPWGGSAFIVLTGAALGFASAWFAVRQAGDLQR